MPVTVADLWKANLVGTFRLSDDSGLLIRVVVHTVKT